MLIQIAAKNSFVVHQMDIHSAYLHSDMDYELFVKQPDGFVEHDNLGNTLFFFLKALRFSNHGKRQQVKI